MKQISKELKEETNCTTMILGYFTTSLSTMDRLSRQIISMEILSLNTFNQMYLPDMYRTFHATAREHIFSSTHGTLPRVRAKTDLGKLKKI
jgi:hypothetical protein